MKKNLKTTAFCFASLFTFYFCALAAGNFRHLTVKPTVRKNETRSGYKLKAASNPSSPAANGCAIEAGSSDFGVIAPGEKNDVTGYTEFDDFNNVSDPLYREGSNVFLKKAIDEDLPAKAVVKGAGIPAKRSGKRELMRDAPADVPAAAIQGVRIKAGDKDRVPIFPVKKNRLIKLVPADPVKAKSTL
jgi:hypothetical protein